ncbi:MAG: class I SAM-dependent methyltransferase [Candidatus Lokiarchaeota archaeon]|nr:class I SAM-dependent methyltransferase [Candidatus Lokiarchaeota archaeon]
MLANAKSKVQNATFFQAKAELLSFDSEYFDYLYCSFAFHHFTNDA